jgi:hypothetical protein
MPLPITTTVVAVAFLIAFTEQNTAGRVVALCTALAAVLNELGRVLALRGTEPLPERPTPIVPVPRDTGVPNIPAEPDE